MAEANTRIGLVQMRMDENCDTNLEKAIQSIETAASNGADVVCLPELFQSRYFCQTEDASFFAHAEPVPGATTERLEAIAENLGIVIIASLFEKRAAGLYHNTAAIINGKEGYIGKYRKMHIPDDPLYYEKFYFTPGDLGFRSWNTNAGSMGVLVCWDQWYPEAARLTALQGADILFYPTAIGWHPSEKEEFGSAQKDAWITMQRSHAIANGCFVVAVNRTGFEPTDPSNPHAEEHGLGIQFWGSSFVIAPDGTIATMAEEETETVQVVEIDPGEIDHFRNGWPFLRDRRIDVYDGLSQRYIDE